jgi:hypothetical protein
MLHVYDGVLRFYSYAAVERHIYDRWFRLVDAKSLRFFLLITDYCF